MRKGAAAAALLVAWCAPSASAQRRDDRVREAGVGLLDPMITTAPDLRQPTGPWSGERDIAPAGEASNLFVGGLGQQDAPSPPPLHDPPPPPPPPPAERRPPPPRAFSPQRLPGEGVRPPDDGMPTQALEHEALDTPGEPQSLAALPAAPVHELVEEDVEAKPAAVSRPPASPAPVAGKLAASGESLPDLPAAPVHEEKPVEPKDVELEDVSLAHDAIPDLIEILKTGSPRLRERAADELGRRGADAKAAVPALEEALRLGPDRLKASAALALGDIGGDRGALMKLLKPLLKSKNADVRTSAQTALSRL